MFFLLSTIAIWITPLPWDPMGNSRLFSSFLFTLIFTTSQLGPVCALARTNTLRCPQLVLERPTSTWVSLCLSLPQGSLTSHDYKHKISYWKRFKLTTLTEDQQPTTITIFPEWSSIPLNLWGGAWTCQGHHKKRATNATPPPPLVPPWLVPTSVQKADHLGIKPLGRNRNLEFVAKSSGTEETRTTSEFLLHVSWTPACETLAGKMSWRRKLRNRIKPTKGQKRIGPFLPCSQLIFGTLAQILWALGSPSSASGPTNFLKSLLTHRYSKSGRSW